MVARLRKAGQYHAKPITRTIAPPAAAQGARPEKTRLIWVCWLFCLGLSSSREPCFQAEVAAMKHVNSTILQRGFES